MMVHDTRHAGGMGKAEEMAAAGIFPIVCAGAAMTQHARSRMQSRAIDRETIELVLMYGRVVHTRGADIHVVGRREIRRLRAQHIILDQCEGVHVICSAAGKVITVYRNHDFSGLRDKARRSWH